MPAPSPSPAPSEAKPAHGHARTFVRSSAGMGVALVARAAGSVLLNKLIAVYGGPGGLTQLAQFQNLMGLFGTLPADGVQVGVTTYLAPLRPGQPRQRLWLGAALWLTAALVGAGGLLLAGLGGGAWPLGRTLTFTVLLLLLLWQSLLGAALLAVGQARVYVALVVLLSLLGPAVVAGLLALGWPLGQVLLGYVAGQALTFGPTLLLAWRARLVGSAWWRPQLPSRVALRRLSRFLLIALGNLVFSRAVNYGVRAYLMAHFSATATDLWQAVDKLSASYSPVVAAVLSTVFYPRLAALAPAPAEQRHYVSVVAGVLALGLGLGLGVVYWAREWVLALLFTQKLAAATSLLAPQLLGDWAKFLTWLFQYTLLVRARPGPYLAVQASGAALYVALLAGLLPTYGLPGVVLAYAAGYGLLLLACLGWYYSQPARRVATRLEGS